MKKYTVFIIICVSIVLLVGCSSSIGHSNDTVKKDEENLPNNESILSMEERAKLVRQGMTYAEVRDIMGNDGKDIGSGAILYQWDLTETQCLYVWMKSVYPNESLETIYPDDCIVVDLQIASKKD